MERISRDTLFMRVADLFGERGTCQRARVGVVAIREGRIIATGYVGSPPGRDHCTDVGCDLRDGHCIRTTHAEANLVAWSARVGTSLAGSVVYTTHSPCRVCARLLATAGVKEVVFAVRYDEDGLIELWADGVAGRQYAFEPTS